VTGVQSAVKKTQLNMARRAKKMITTDTMVSEVLNQELKRLWRIQVQRPGGSGGRISSDWAVIEAKLAIIVFEHPWRVYLLSPFFKLDATIIYIHNNGGDNAYGQVGDHDHRKDGNGASSLVNDGATNKKDIQVAYGDSQT